MASNLYGVDIEGNEVHLIAVGNMKTQLSAYSWPTEWNYYGEATGSVERSFNIEKDGEF